MDHRLGLGVGVLRGGDHRQHQLESLFSGLLGGLRRAAAAGLDRLPLGWGHRQHPCFPDRGLDEYLLDSRDGGQLYFQWYHRFFEGLRGVDVRGVGLAIHPHGELHPLYPGQYGYVG